MSMSPAQFTEVKSILRSSTIEQLAEVLAFARELQKQKGNALLFTLKKGDRVELSGLRPKHINGAIVTVVETRKTRILVTNPRGFGPNTSVPASCCVPR